MNKIIDSKKNILKICAGNDFSIVVQITEYDTETGAWVNYDLSAVSDVHMTLVAENGKHIKLPVVVNEDGTVSAPVQAAYLQKSTYGIELTWVTNDLNRRTYSPCLMQIVTTTAESSSNIAEYETNDAYHFNIKMQADVAILSIGKISDEYITEDDVDNKLENYVTNSALSTTLNDYATKQYVEDELANIDLTDYYTKSEINTTLEDYGTSLSFKTNNATPTDIFQLNGIISLHNQSSDILSSVNIPAFKKRVIDDRWLITPANADAGLINRSTVETIYSTEDRVATIESDYITSTSLSSTLNDYVTNSALSTTLNDYATKQYVDDELANIDLTDYYTKSEINTTLENYVTDSELNTAISPFITNLDLSNVLENYVSNVALEQDLEDYVTNTALSTTLADYASETDMTAAQGDITSLDTRVTTLENNPSVPSNVVTSDDGNEIICLTQAEYDALEQAQTLDTDVFYYITDTTSNYVTNSSLTTTLADYALLTDIPTVPTATSDLTNDSGFITMGDLPTIPSATSDLTNDSGFVSSSSITSILQISQSDYDTLVNNSQVDANTLYIIV